jgi:hypothetical protein
MITRRIAVVDITDFVAVHSHSAITDVVERDGRVDDPVPRPLHVHAREREYMPSKLAVNIALWQTMPVPMNSM